MITTKHQYAPLTNPADVSGTILENQDKDLTIRLPHGIYEDITQLRLPARLKQLKVTDAGPAITDLQRAADKVVQEISRYCESDIPENRLRVKETIGVFIRNVHRHLAWRFDDAINPRDSKNTSSAYLVGVPAIRHAAIEDGLLCDLKPWQVALNPSVIRRLGIVPGSRVQLIRFPETRTVVVEVVEDETIGYHCIGLPVGEPNLAKALGGDCDGDCYAIRAYHTAECQAELKAAFDRQWSECPETTLSESVLTWKDEQPSELTDEEIGESKSLQKVAIGPTTLDWMAVFVVKLAARDRLPLTYEQIRRMMERSIEVVMDSKHVDGHNPLLMHKLINGEVELDDAVVQELTEQGFVIEDVHTLLDFINEWGGNLRKLARSNPAYDVLLGGHDAVERFIDTAPEDLAHYFVDSLFARRMRKPSPRRYHERLTRPKGRYGNHHFVATLDRKTGELVVECGLAEYRIQTSENGKAIRLSPVEVVLFRPSVEVQFVERNKELTTSCILHTGFASVINTIARSEFAWEVWEIISQPDPEISRADLERLVKKILRRMLKAYEIEGTKLDRWDTYCATRKYVVLDLELPRIEGYDFIRLEMMRRRAAGEELVRRGLINHRSDTTCSQPGMAFYARAGAGSTAVTASDPLNSLSSLKRSSVRNAMGNLVEITGAEPESFVTDAALTPPMIELRVASLPLNAMDGVLVSSAVCDRLTAKIPKVIGGLDFGSYEYYPLEDGSKIQGRLDLKGVARIIPEESMPWIRYADGTTVRAEVVMALDSVGHQMLRHSHCTIALTAAAHKLRETTGGRMRVPSDVTPERIARVARLSGLYDSDDMTAEILRPNGELIGSYPAGMSAIGVHRQTPSTLASVHGREKITDFPTSTAAGGVVSGLAGALCMLAEGLEKCCEELHREVNPELEAEIQALRSCIVRR